MLVESKQETKSTKVFIVDDEAMIANTLAIILENCGFTAVAYTNPVKALQVPDDSLPDLLVSDVSMPELSGIELAIRMTNRKPRCKVLLFSGEAATADLLKHARSNGHDFMLLAKPIHPSDLIIQIKKL